VGRGADRFRIRGAGTQRGSIRARDHRGSGAAIGTQVTATIAFVVVMLAVVEIALANYLAAPAKTEAVLRMLHEWARAHRRKILVAACAVGGVWMVANGMGSI
jgi:hypothetical protein